MNAQAVGFVDRVNDGDVGMLERGGRLRFLHEALPAFGVVDEIVGQDLERDLAIEAQVHRAVDHAHAAAADLVEDLVVRKRAPDQPVWGVCHVGPAHSIPGVADGNTRGGRLRRS